MKSVSQTSAHSESVLEPSKSTATGTASAMAPATTSHYLAGASPSPPAKKGGIWTEFDTQFQASQQHCTAGTDAVIEMHQYYQFQFQYQRSQFHGLETHFFGGK